ncbi:hypothetical protein TrVE_jg9780 [Triparma verrucosa]|uniref:Alpha-1,3-glucosyltransferase n=1 Tax=Triparma verrucosa TaxID=1606542 RepID=A0A9W7B7L7_9STRA|nr:hypothetical protein TrVE_jg9780 [Triparma verrucosa]
MSQTRSKRKVPFEITPKIFIFLAFVPLLLLSSTFSGHGGSGDFHAHKKWISLTLNLPPTSWYSHELEWWGLDYPPFSVYYHWVFGRLVAALGQTDSFDLTDRTGVDTVPLLRLLIVAFNALVYYLPVYYMIRSSHRPASRGSLTLLMYMPILMLVDVGHFQISNYVPSALTVITLHYLNLELDNRGGKHENEIGVSSQLKASSAFMASVLFKQMQLYLSLPIFVHLLRWCTVERDVKKSSKSFIALNFLRKLAILGVTVVGLTVVALIPFRSDVSQVVRRVFPVGRGLYESKVANLWCMLDTRPFDIQRRLPPHIIKGLCGITTLLGSAPFLARIWRNKNVDLNTNVAGCGMAAFLFSYHAHEKSCLVFLPAFVSAFEEGMSGRMILMCGMGCRFLLELDGLVYEYLGMTVAFLAYFNHFYGGLGKLFKGEEWIDYLQTAVISFSLLLEFAMPIVPNPVPQLPDLYELAIAGNTFLGFFGTWAWMVMDMPTTKATKAMAKKQARGIRTSSRSRSRSRKSKKM